MACGTVLQKVRHCRRQLHSYNCKILTCLFRFDWKSLEPGEKILVDTDSILCFEDTVQIDVQWVGNVKAICCGGEG